MTYPISYKYTVGGFIFALISYLDNAYMMVQREETTGMVKAHRRFVLKINNCAATKKTQPVLKIEETTCITCVRCVRV